MLAANARMNAIQTAKRARDAHRTKCDEVHRCRFIAGLRRRWSAILPECRQCLQCWCEV